MAAPNGNSNALVWTVDKVELLLDQLEELLIDNNVIYMGQALAICKTSSRQWRRIKEMYQDTEEIIDRIELIEEDIEQRIVVGGMNGTLKSNMTQFILRSKCGYVDKAPAEAKKSKKTDEIDEATLEAIQEVTGPLLETFVKSKSGKEKLRQIAGMTKEQMAEAGYGVQYGTIYGPDSPYIRVSETQNIYL
jgi:hypothetical protein